MGDHQIAPHFDRFSILGANRADDCINLVDLMLARNVRIGSLRNV
jgi:hypothetical protein